MTPRLALVGRSIPTKPIVVGPRVVGYARTWEEVARLLGWGSTVAELQHNGAEGPDAFWMQGSVDLP